MPVTRSSTSAPASLTSRRPQHVKDAAKAAIDAQLHALHDGDGHSRSCARRSARSYKRHYGIDARSAEVLLTVGGKQALFNTALALFNPGDEVITHAPYWPTIPEQIKIAEATPVIVQTKLGRRLHRARRDDHRGDHAEDEGDHPQLAVQSDRRR